MGKWKIEVEQTQRRPGVKNTYLPELTHAVINDESRYVTRRGTPHLRYRHI